MRKRITKSLRRAARSPNRRTRKKIKMLARSLLRLQHGLTSSAQEM